MSLALTDRFARIPPELIDKIFSFIPNDVASFAQGSRSCHEIVAQFSNTLLQQLSQHPILSSFLSLKFLINEKDPILKLKKLSLTIQSSDYNKKNPGYSVNQFARLANAASLDDVFAAACSSGEIKRIQELIDREFCSQCAIDKGLLITAANGDIPLVQLLTPLASDAPFKDNYSDNVLYIALNAKKIFNQIIQHLINSKRVIDCNYALEEAARVKSSKTVALILKSKLTIDTTYSANCGTYEIRDNRRGLHSAILLAAQRDRIQVVSTLLKHTQPSQQILIHVRKRLLELKSHMENGTRLNQQIYKSRYSMKLRNVTHRDKIIAMLTEKIGPLPPEEPPPLSPFSPAPKRKSPQKIAALFALAAIPFAYWAYYSGLRITFSIP